MFDRRGPTAEADTLAEWLAALVDPRSISQVAAIAMCIVFAWGALALFRRRVEQPGILIGARAFDGALFPLLALALVLATRWAFRELQLGAAYFRIAVPLLASLCLIRIGVRVLHAAFPTSRAMRLAERWLSWLVWLGFALWVTNLLPLVLQALDEVRWKIGDTELSLRHLIEGGVTGVVVLMAALWLASTIENRLLVATRLSVSARKIAANGVRALLLLVGFLLAMSAAGVPLAALSVFGGAIGVGIGLGLQKLAANYVSGFVILAERSLRIGDVVRIDSFEGRITDIKTRYTVLRAINGRESLVPNEMMITQRVENCHFADPNVAMTSAVQVAYGTDLDRLIPQLVAAMAGVPRVLGSPAPTVQLSSFAADGLELTLVFWIGDIENGQGNVVSEVNLAALRTIVAAGVQIPYPQRVVRMMASAD